MPRPLRLLLIGSLPPPLGGTAVSFRQLVDELAGRSDVAARVIDISRGERDHTVDRLRVLGMLLGRAPRRIWGADIVTFHASTPGVLAFGPVLLALCRGLGRPLVVRGFGGSFDSEYQEMSALARRALVTAFRADRVLFQTRAQLAFFQDLLPRARLLWYPNSRPVGEPFVPPPDRRPRSFVFVGHVKPTKGIPEIVGAARLLGERCRIDVYGPFHDGCTRQDVEAAPNLRYRGVLAPEQVISTLRGYDAVLLPTVHFGEGYPGIVLEAYAAGRPVIATRWRAIPEIVEDGVSGLLVVPRATEELAAAMGRLCDSTKLLESLARGASRRAADFSSERWTAEFVRICTELWQERAGPAGPAF
jgi:glycosyltransferase involved in cell wall biosynthesis